MFVGLLGVGAITSIGLGAILTFAVDWQWEGANRELVGLIMMAVGILALSAFVSVQHFRDDHSGRYDHYDRHFPD
jgi:uncharacterized membrane protein (Fun14 family)